MHYLANLRRDSNAFDYIALKPIFDVSKYATNEIGGRAVAYELHIAYCILHIVYCLLPMAYCLLPIAHCLLPDANCLLTSQLLSIP